MNPAVLLALASAATGGATNRATTCPEVKPLNIRYLEDYSSYRAPACRSNLLRRLKLLPLGDESFVSLGGQLRLRWERFENERLGRIPTDGDGQLLLRGHLHADVWASPRWRGYFELRSTTILGRKAEPSPLDRDALDVHQLFVQARYPVLGGQMLFRLGRQEVARDFRLVSTREWPNLRLSFDGLLLSWSNGMMAIDAYGAVPAGNNDGAFDDVVPDGQQAVYGVHAVLRPKRIIEGVSVFFVGFYDESSRFVTQVQSSERRESIGAHIWLKEGLLRASMEGVLQVGRAGALDIFAWLFAGELGLDLRLGGGALELRTLVEVGSGDDDPADGTLGSFNAFYPNNRFFGGTAVVGAFSNAVHVSTSVSYARAPLRAVVSLEQFWRESTQDVVYGPSGFPSIVVPNANAAFVGHQVDLQLGWTVTRYVDLLARYAWFAAGDYPRMSTNVEDTHYLAVQLRLRL